WVRSRPRLCSRPRLMASMIVNVSGVAFGVPRGTPPRNGAGNWAARAGVAGALWPKADTGSRKDTPLRTAAGRTDFNPVPFSPDVWLDEVGWRRAGRGENV